MSYSKFHEPICIDKSNYEWICSKQVLELVKQCEVKIRDHTHVIGLNQLLPNFLLTGLIMLRNVGYHGSLEPQEQIFAIEIRKIHSTYNEGRQNFN